MTHEQPTGDLIAGTKIGHNYTNLTTTTAGILDIWVRFGSIGWEHVASCPYEGTTVGELSPSPSWKGHPQPFSERVTKKAIVEALADNQDHS